VELHEAIQYGLLEKIPPLLTSVSVDTAISVSNHWVSAATIYLIETWKWGPVFWAWLKDEDVHSLLPSPNNNKTRQNHHNQVILLNIQQRISTTEAAIVLLYSL